MEKLPFLYNKLWCEISAVGQEMAMAGVLGVSAMFRAWCTMQRYIVCGVYSSCPDGLVVIALIINYS